MHKIIIRAAVLLLVMTVLVACGQNGRQSGQEADPIEQQVQELRLRLDALEQRHAQEVEDLRTDLKNVLTYLNIALENLTAKQPQEAPRPGDKEDSFLKRSLEDNLRILLDLSREMIDRLERELDQSVQRDRQQGSN